MRALSRPPGRIGNPRIAALARRTATAPGFLDTDPSPAARGPSASLAVAPAAGAARAPTEKDSALRLSLYTDLSLRLLLYLGTVESGGWTTTPAVARTFGVSLNHLQKVARGLTGAGYIEARQGRSGGVRLARPPAEVRLGALVAELEGLGCLVECGRGPCPLAGRCLLKTALDAAERSFIRELDRFTLADVLAGPTGATLRDLIGRDAEGAGEPGA